MAQPQDISVARAVFITSLLRHDHRAADISRDDATLFARAILRTCNICTSSNIKVCKSFIVRYILPAGSRTAALSKYLLNLAKSFAPRDLDARVDATKTGDENEGLGKVVNGKLQQPPDAAFKRLHLLYILHDVLLHQYSHRHLVYADDESSEQMAVLVGKIAELAVCGSGAQSTNACPAVLEVLAYWSEAQILPTDRLDSIRANVHSLDGTEWEAGLAQIATMEATNRDFEKKRLEDETKWIIPDRHGVPSDPTAPWHELPAANGLYVKRTAGSPLYANSLPPGGMRVQNGGDEASTDLKQDVRSLYEEVLRCYDRYTPADEVQDIDALGNVIWKDPERPTRNYWGFTLEGIDKRKELAAQFAATAGQYGDNDGYRVNAAVERARALAAERGRAMSRGRGMGGRGGWESGRR